MGNPVKTDKTVDPKVTPDKDIGDKGTEAKSTSYKVCGVFDCHVKAYSGLGNLTALILSDGHFRLYGKTNLETIGLITESQKKLQSASGLSDALSHNNGKKKVYIGREQCLKALSEHSVPASDISPDDIIRDAKVRKGGSGKGSVRSSITDFS